MLHWQIYVAKLLSHYSKDLKYGFVRWVCMCVLFFILTIIFFIEWNMNSQVKNLIFLCVFFVVFTAQKIKFSIKGLVTFTEEIVNGKLHFLHSVWMATSLKVLQKVPEIKRKPICAFWAIAVIIIAIKGNI